MKSLMLCIVLVALSLTASSCAFKSKTDTAFLPPAQKADVSHLISKDLSFAKDFVQALSDADWEIQEVRHSKFNSFFADSRNAAFIRTDKGVVEAVFFQSKDDVEQIRVSEEPTEDSNIHRYTIQKLPKTNQRMEGRYWHFTKYRNAFVITIDREAHEALSRLPA